MIEYVVKDKESMRDAFDRVMDSLNDVLEDGIKDPAKARLDTKRILAEQTIVAVGDKLTKDEFEQDFDRFKTFMTKITNVMLDQTALFNKYAEEA